LRWSEAEEALLRDVSLSLAEVAERTGRSRSSCKNKAQYLAIDRSFRGRFDGAWSTSELLVLRDSTLTYGQVAEMTGRSLSAVEHMSLRQGIDRSARTGVGLKVGDDNPWSEVEAALLWDLELSLQEVAALTGRTYASAKRKASLLGVKRHDGSWVATYRGSGWPAARREVLERDGFTCQDCQLFQPSGKDLHVHHVIPYRLLPANLPRWLVTLCNSCHRQRPEHRWLVIPPGVLLQVHRSDRSELLA
jgi:HNH endonuclease